MRHISSRRRLKKGLILPIGVAWLALLAVPALKQIVEGKAINTIGDAAAGAAAAE